MGIFEIAGMSVRKRNEILSYSGIDLQFSITSFFEMDFFGCTRTDVMILRTIRTQVHGLQISTGFLNRKSHGFFEELCIL